MTTRIHAASQMKTGSTHWFRRQSGGGRDYILVRLARSTRHARHGDDFAGGDAERDLAALELHRIVAE